MASGSEKWAGVSRFKKTKASSRKKTIKKYSASDIPF